LCTDVALTKMMKQLYGDSVLHCKVVRLVDFLDGVMKKRQRLIAKWKEASDISREQHDNHVMMKTGFLGIFGDRVEALPYLEGHVNTIDHRIIRMKKQPYSTTNTGFVTFDCVSTAVQCAQTVIHRDYMNPKLAPYPEDINWYIFSKTGLELMLRKLVVFALLAVLFVFWSIPVGIVTAFSNLQTLSKIHGADIIVWMANRSELIRSLLEGLLPTIALSIFLVILPFLLKFILSLRGYLLNSAYDRMLMSAHWFFLVINVFLFSVATSTVLDFNYYNKILGQPLMLLNLGELLASSLPSQALRFMNYIAFEGFIGYPLFFLLRVDDMIITLVKRWFAKTEQQRADADKPPPFDFPIQYAREFFIFSMGMTYAAITPFIVPFAALYFALAYLSAKHNFIFVYSPNYKGRKVTQMVLDRILFSLFLFQITMLGMFTLKRFTPGVLVLVPTVATPFFRWWLKGKYFKSSKYLALLDCPKEKAQPDERQMEEMQRLYEHPALHPLEPLNRTTTSNEDEALTRQMDEQGIIPPSNPVRRSQPADHTIITLEESQEEHEGADLVELDINR